jgi:hypothetical protein
MCARVIKPKTVPVVMRYAFINLVSVRKHASESNCPPHIKPTTELEVRSTVRIQDATRLMLWGARSGTKPKARRSATVVMFLAAHFARWFGGPVEWHGNSPRRIVQQIAFVLLAATQLGSPKAAEGVARDDSACGLAAVVHPVWPNTVQQPVCSLWPVDQRVATERVCRHPLEILGDKLFEASRRTSLVVPVTPQSQFRREQPQMGSG